MRPLGAGEEKDRGAAGADMRGMPPELARGRERGAGRLGMLARGLLLNTLPRKLEGRATWLA